MYEAFDVVKREYTGMELTEEQIIDTTMLAIKENKEICFATAIGNTTCNFYLEDDDIRLDFGMTKSVIGSVGLANFSFIGEVVQQISEIETKEQLKEVVDRLGKNSDHFGILIGNTDYIPVV